MACPACATISQLSPGPSPFGNAAYARPPLDGDERWLSLLEANHAGRTLIDLGCGNGAFLRLASARDWDCAGVEREPALVADGRDHGLRIDEHDLDTWEPAGHRLVDVVRLWFVLEHVWTPGALLRKAKSLLKPGGLLLLAVPNDAGWLSRAVMKTPDDRFWEHPLHLHHYPPFGLEQWLHQCGFDLLIGEAGRPTELMRGGTLPLYETWEKVRHWDPSLSRLFYQLGVGRSRELLFRLRDEK